MAFVFLDFSTVDPTRLKKGVIIMRTLGVRSAPRLNNSGDGGAVGFGRRTFQLRVYQWLASTLSLSFLESRWGPNNIVAV